CSADLPISQIRPHHLLCIVRTFLLELCFWILTVTVPDPGLNGNLARGPFGFLIEYSTTRPSDLPLNVIVQSGNSQAVKAKVVLQMAAPLLGDLGRNENRTRPLPLPPMLNPFIFLQNRAINAFSMASGRARPSGVSPAGIHRE